MVHHELSSQWVNDVQAHYILLLLSFCSVLSFRSLSKWWRKQSGFGEILINFRCWFWAIFIYSFYRICVLQGLIFAIGSEWYPLIEPLSAINDHKLVQLTKSQFFTVENVTTIKPPYLVCGQGFLQRAKERTPEVVSKLCVPKFIGLVIHCRRIWPKIVRWIHRAVASSASFTSFTGLASYQQRQLRCSKSNPD